MGRLVLTLAFLLAPSFALAPQGAAAAGFDGRWTVLIITDSGTCDRGYRYEVAVENGQVRYVGGASVTLAGTVSHAGAVTVSISKGKQHANGTGKLGADAGVGRWSGQSSAGACAGRWEAERR